MNDRLPPPSFAARSRESAEYLRDAAGQPEWIGTVRSHELAPVLCGDPLLGPLYRGGLDIHTIGVFGRRATATAEVLGRRVDLLATWLDDARCRTNAQTGGFAFRVPTQNPSRRREIKCAIESLQKTGLVVGHPFADRKSFYRPFWRFTLSTSSVVRRVVRGEWLTALAAGVLDDQARRLQVDVATRTLVELGAAPDLGGWRGELDVLSVARVDGEERVLWLECKTGAPRNIDVARLARQKQSLATVLARSGMSSREPEVVVVVPPATRPAREEEQSALWQRLAAVGITLVDTHQLRSWVRYALRSEDRVDD